MSPPPFGKEDLLDLLHADSQEHIALLQSLIRTPSSTPPGDTVDAINVVRHYLDTKGVTSDLIAPVPHSPNLVSVLYGSTEAGEPGSDRTLVLNGHIDQFPVGDADKWQRDPYSGDVDGEYVYGRSGVDMKAGTAASIIAFGYLHRLREHISGRCTLEVVSDEEAGGRWGTRYLLEDDGAKEWRGDFVLVGEPSGLNSIRFGEKGTLRIDFEVTAPGAHGAYTHRSEGAIRIASRFIERLVLLEKVDLGMDKKIREHMQQPEVRKLADEIMWEGASNSMLFPTVNIGTIHGGTSINMVPSECTFAADIRIPIGVKTAAVLSYIDGIVASFSRGSTVAQDIALKNATVSGTWNIYATLCTPQQNVKPKGVQLLTHGVGFDNTYWDFAQDYSYVDVAAKAGYASFFYDRLGVGKSDKPDAIQVIQGPLEVEIAHVLATSLRKGQFSDNKFEKVVGAGHSFGSIITNAITRQYPAALDAAILTGFSTDLSTQPLFLEALNLAIAKENQPLRFGELNNAFLVSSTVISNQIGFFKAPGFAPAILDKAEATKGTVTLGELNSLSGIAGPAANYTKPVAVIDGANDLPFCGGNCTYPTDQAKAVQPAYYPNVKSEDFGSYLAPLAGHGLNFHYSAAGAYEYIQKFLTDRGLGL